MKLARTLTLLAATLLLPVSAIAQGSSDSEPAPAAVDDAVTRGEAAAEEAASDEEALSEQLDTMNAPPPVVTPPPPVTPKPPALGDPAPRSPAASSMTDRPVTTDVVDPAPSPTKRVRSEFSFGSYARVRAASDLNGGIARPNNVVSFGSRIDEESYAELEFAQRFEVPQDSGMFFAQTVATLAFLNDLFHFTGDFDQTMAMRNLYGHAGWRVGKDWALSFWAGSRMYRGDDIYLLDFWPLDNLNTVGGGAEFALNTSLGRTELKLHSGLSRLTNNFQFQQVEVPGLDFGAETIVFLNRQRQISSARAQQDIWLKEREGAPLMGMKLMLYGEDHRLAAGERRDPDGLTTTQLDAESGAKLGAQVGLWTADGFFKGSFLNLFYTYTSDLATYGEFGVPQGLNFEETSVGASSHQLAMSADLETPYAGMLLGAYYKDFQNADPNTTFHDYWEASLAARAHWYATDHIHPGVEVSYQVRSPEGVSPRTGNFEAPSVTKLSFIQALTLDKGMYSRPQLRFIYSAAFLNDSALNLYAPEDPRRGLAVQHYLGVMVEWWFNNASLFRP